jgi:uncharacterized protein YjiS (DUF1127 family)
MRHVTPHELDAAVRRGCEAHPAGPAPAPRNLFARIGALLLEWVRRWADRCELRWIAEHYPDELLEDAGLSRADLLTEARKPFWRR